MSRHTPHELDSLERFQSTRDHALIVDCPHCFQPAREPCVFPNGTEHPAPAHWQRIRAATLAAANHDPDGDSP